MISFDEEKRQNIHALSSSGFIICTEMEVKLFRRSGQVRRHSQVPRLEQSLST
jgi:hypothetical protein